MNFLLNLLRVRRIEFRIAELPIFIMPILLSIRPGVPINTAALVEGIILLLFLFAFGDIINCLADRDLDATYKPHLSKAVYGLGINFVKVQIALSALAALLLSVHIAWLLDRWVIPWLVFGGLLLGAAYSVEPVRLKGRGVAQIPCLWTIIFFGPMILAALLVSPRVSPSMLAFAAAYATLQMGLILINTAEDYPEDKAAGVRTSIVALGLKRGMSCAFWFGLVGGVALSMALNVQIIEHDIAPSVRAFTQVLPSILYWPLYMALWTVKREVATRDEEHATAFVKQAAKKVPILITLAAWGTCLAVMMLYSIAMEQTSR